jgi:signal transduction histidine kinase
MNTFQNTQVNEFSINDATADYRTANIHPERLLQYATHLETQLLHKNIEVNELRSVMESHYEEERQKQLEHDQIMLHQARHAAMGEILGVIAHKWRQPLNSISLIIQNMVDAWKYGEMDDELVERSEYRVMEQISLLSRTIDDFRSFLDPVTVSEYFDPVESVKSVIAMLSGIFSDFSAVNIMVEEDSSGVIQVHGCQHAFQQVIFNLLSNANDAIRERQRGNSRMSNGIITVSFTSSEDDVVISVADNGGGIIDSSIKHIFEPYFTTKEKNDVFGIGLYTSRLIVEKSMNGSLWFENIHEGACFNIRLHDVSKERSKI